MSTDKGEMMISHEEKEEIVSEIRHAVNKEAVAIHALKVIQKYRGWVSDDAIDDIADLLDMTPAEVDSRATFYSLIFRQPVGRHVILVCDSVSCWLMGYEDIKKHLMEKLGITLGQTTGDGKFTLLPAACLGACDEAPAMMINETLYTNLTPSLIDSILAKYKHL
jgi:NADH-quinone oxidoreductase subunit E